MNAILFFFAALGWLLYIDERHYSSKTSALLHRSIEQTEKCLIQWQNSLSMVRTATDALNNLRK